MSEQSAAHTKGRLKVYLGAMPGSGKTFAMLREGRDLRSQGEDVAVGFVETHGRPRTAEAVGNLEVVPRLAIDYSGTTLEEMDVDAVIARHPRIVLIDELAHTNAPGSRHTKRWQDIRDVVAAGIDVITTLNVQHLESVKDVVERITGITVHETVPDAVLDDADDVHFIDITPEALRKRMKHGNIYPADRVDTALRNFFRPGNLAALREIALRYVAGRIDPDHISGPPEDVMVAISGRVNPGSLLRRATRLARHHRGFCTAVSVREGGTHGASEWKQLAEQLECNVIEMSAKDPAKAIIALARERNVGHLVVGEPRRTKAVFPWQKLFLDRLIDELPDVEIHVIAQNRLLRDREYERPDPSRFLHRERALHQGYLRIYLGYARGCGTTRAMLDEGRRRLGRGTDVVVGAVSPKELDTVPPLPMLGGSDSPAATGKLDVGAVLNRNPDVCCVDDLAAVTTTGIAVSEAIGKLLDAGIIVLATVHLTDIRSVAEALHQFVEREANHFSVPDEIIDSANEIELVDVPPTVLDERLRKGTVMSPAEAAQALQGEFRPSMLATLREMAFRRIAEHTDRHLVEYMENANIAVAWEARPRILVYVPPRPDFDDTLKRIAQYAKMNDGIFAAVSVRRQAHDDVAKHLLGHYATLTHQLGGEFVSMYRESVAGAIARYSRESRITEIIIARDPQRREFSAVKEVVHLVANVDVHILGAGTNR